MEPSPSLSPVGKRPGEASAVPTEVPVDAASRLLAAAEHRILQGGLGAVSLRTIADAAEANSALVSYYFGNLAGLLAKVGHANVDLMLNDRSVRLAAALAEPDKEQRIVKTLEAQAFPLLMPSACTGQRYASSVVRELLGGKDEDFKALAVKAIISSTAEVLAVLAPLVPHLSADSLQLRMRFLSGATTYLAPQIDSLGLFVAGGRHSPVHLDAARAELIAFARGSISQAQADVLS